MDHHCHWVNNCIHQNNHKYFLQTISYGLAIAVLTIIHYSIIIYSASSCKVSAAKLHKNYIFDYGPQPINKAIYNILLVDLQPIYQAM